jgi:hypothetical protein
MLKMILNGVWGSVGTSVSVAAVATWASAVAHAGDLPTVTPLVVGGDNYNDLALVNSLSTAEFLAINNAGEWIVEALGEGSISMLITGTETSLPGTVIIAEGEDVPDPAPSDAVFLSLDEMRINNNGNFSANLFYAPPTNTDAVFFNTTLLITEGDVSTATGFAPGTVWVNWWGTYIDDNDSILLIGNVDEPRVGDTSDPAVVVVDDPAGAATQTVLAKEGDELVPGRFLANVSTSTHNNAFANGRAIVVIDLDGDTADDGILGLHDGSNWTVVIQEGTPCPLVPGRNWGTIGTATGVDINNNGDWAARTTLNAPLTDDTLIVKNGAEIIAREGDPVPALGGAFNFGNFSNTAVHIDDDGNVYYFASWNDTSQNSGLFRNDELLVRLGVTVADTGELLSSLSGGQANMVVADNGQFMLFEGTLTDPKTNANRQGAIFVDLRTAVLGDLDDDGDVDADDRAALCGTLGSSLGDPNYIPAADLNGDETIDHLDQQLFNDVLPLCGADVVNNTTFQPPADGVTDAADLAYLLGAWGSQPSCADFVTNKTFAPPPDGVVDAADLAFLLGAWGTCE